MIWLFWRRFRPKSAILATFAMFVFLGTSKFEIYMKKQSRIRRETVVLGGCVGDLSADCTIIQVPAKLLLLESRFVSRAIHDVSRVRIKVF